MQRYFRLSHRGNSLYRGHIWSDFRMITQEPALPRFGKKHSGRGQSKCKGHEVGTSMTFWGTEGGSTWLEFAECQGDVYRVVGKSQIVLVGLAHLWSTPAHAPGHLWPDLTVLPFCHFTYIVSYYLFTYKYSVFSTKC